MNSAGAYVGRALTMAEIGTFSRQRYYSFTKFKFSLRRAPTYHRKEVKEIVELLNSDPKICKKVISKLNPHARVHLRQELEKITIVPENILDTTREELMSELAEKFDKADVNNDNQLSRDEFHRFMEIQTEQNLGPPTKGQLVRAAIQNGTPFVGFGILDNAIMICAGTAIETSIGVTFGMSAMAAAALGNLVSDVSGVGLGGTIEAFASKLGIKDPKLSKAQMNLPVVSLARNLGAAVGVAIGCLIGMFPLLLIDESAIEDASHVIHEEASPKAAV